jgi:hypothetical protein
MNPIPPFIPICEDADYQITDTDDNILYSGTIPSGGSLEQPIQDSTYLVEYENGTPIESGSILAEGSAVIQVPNPVTCADAVVNVNSVFFDNVASGGTLNIPVINNGSNPVGSIVGSDVVVGNTEVFINSTQVGDVLAEDSLSIAVELDGTPSGTWNAGTQTWEVASPDTSLEVNGTPEGTFAAGSTIDVQLTDGVNPVTPDSVTVVGNVVTIEVPAATPAPVGATLMKTGQTTSYRTGDDGDLEAGRATDFFTLASNNPFGNTNRFTDELGAQTYTNNIVIDWSTYNGATVTGWYKEDFNTATLVIGIWNTAIDNALSLTVSTFVGWKIPNIRELQNIMNYSTGNLFNYSPFNNTSLTVVWSSTTPAESIGSALVRSGSQIITRGKTATSYSLRCRTFTVTGTTLT